MSEIVKDLGQEWCNAENVNLKQTGLITTFEPNTQEWMVLCRKEEYKSSTLSDSGTSSIEMGTRYIPLKYEDLNTAEEN